MAPTPEEVAALVRHSIPGAEVSVHLYAGDDHFEVEVVADAFRGKSRVVQHQMVYAALGENMKEAIHALALKTSVPKEQA